MNALIAGLTCIDIALVCIVFVQRMELRELRRFAGRASYIAWLRGGES